MCLGVPGKVIEIEQQAPGMLMGKATFGGITKSVCLSYVPDVRLSDYVVVIVAGEESGPHNGRCGRRATLQHSGSSGSSRR
jgi:hypothetical protein